ncbi:MAG: hypothetical protein ACK5JI_10020, partial [Azonexus sp.]
PVKHFQKNISPPETPQTTKNPGNPRKPRILPSKKNPSSGSDEIFLTSAPMAVATLAVRGETVTYARVS